MTGSDIGVALAAAGLDAREIPARVRLFHVVLQRFADVARRPPEHAWWVPGRLEVFGTHTDYAGGRSLVGAVPRGFVLAASARSDRLVRVIDALRGDEVTVDPTETRFAFRGWRHYVEVVAERLGRNFPEAPLGADILFASDLPRASGMSSSSALVVGVATALVRIGRLRERREWTTNVHDLVQEAAYYSCLENGLSFGSLTGDAGVGTHGGSEDHAAMLCSTPGSLIAFRFVPMTRIEVVAVPADWRFVVCATGVSAEKTGAARDAYNRLARGAEILLELWNGAGRAAVSLGAALESAPDALERLGNLVARSAVSGWTPHALRRRLDHFVNENARVEAAVRALRDIDAPRLAMLARASQDDAERLLSNQIEATIVVARTAYDAGAFAARSFGAGFGGSVWALVEASRAEEFAVRWLASCRPLLPSGAQPVAFVATLGTGVVEV